MKEKEDIPEVEEDILRHPYVQYLHRLLHDISEKQELQDKKVAELESELRRLKKLPKKPDIKRSKLDDNKEGATSDKKQKKSNNWSKGKKKEKLEIHEKREIKAKNIPNDWVLAGYEFRVRQDMLIRANNIEYRLEVWRSPDGENRRVAELPVHLRGVHFGGDLKAYILHQYYECCVTQPQILSSLRDFGVRISSGQISAILTDRKEEFHKEKESLLSKGIELGGELRTDDTGARHQFKNGFCNCINSSLFTYFTTTFSKSRINFLEILRLARTDYWITETALAYLEKEKISPKYYRILKQSYEDGQVEFRDEEELLGYLSKHNFNAAYALKKIREALLIGSIVKHGFDPDTVIHSDGAGQFNLFVHSLCWKHAERPLVKLKCYNPIQEQVWESKMNAFWSLYQELKKYKENPSPQRAIELEYEFDTMCGEVDYFSGLNKVLAAIKAKKKELLLVLERPEISLHNNDSERDIREYAKRRKISAGTRSENGRKARDTFLSLKKTCRKLEISFWEYLKDRLQNLNSIPRGYPEFCVLARKSILVISSHKIIEFCLQNKYTTDYGF